MPPSPSVSLLTTPLNILYGETGTLVLSLKEQAATGFSPWLELLVPAPSQHLAFGAASWAGGSLNANVLSFAGPEPSGPYTLKHPYTGELLRGNKGDRLLIWKPPVGSYAADAPALELRVPVEVSATSPTFGNVAIQAGGGYALGSDPLDNSAADKPLKAISQPGFIIPQVILLDKDPLTPEFETASGPNFSRQWQLNINVAAGQTLKDLKINDNLPLGPIYLGTNALAQNLISASALIEKQPKLNAAVTAANNELIINYGTVTGSTGDVDLQALVSFYIPQVINQVTAAPITFTNTAKLAGRWTNPPVGSSADLEVVDQDAQPETITAKALAIQKTDDKSETFSPDGQELAGQVLPGETVEFKLDFQISDYFAFGNLSIEDILGDGLSYLAGTAKIQLQEQGQSLTNGAFIPYLDRYLVSTKDYELGKDKLVFKLSEWLTGAALSRADDGILQGGLVAAKAGATQCSILFKARVDDQFVAPKAAGLTIKAADTLRNDVTLNGTIYNYIAGSASFAPTNTIIIDVSAENLRISQPTLEKTIVARNGQALVSSLLFAPGDTITYRLKAILPTGDLQGVSLSDWLPTPAFNVSVDAINAVFENSGSGASPSQPPAAGTFAYGSEHTAPQLTNNQILVGPGTNQLTATLPNSSDVLNKQQILDIYYTVRATSAAMADRLSQTNISQLTYTSSDGTQHSTDLAVATAENLAPDLKIRKGVLNSSRDSGSTAAGYAPTRNYGGVAFAAAGSTGLPFSSGILTSAAISETGGNGSTGAIKNNILNSNISKLDAGDILRYVIIIENIGSSYRGAFNVQVRDEIPAGLSYHGNLAIVDGTGAVLTYTKPDQTAATAADFFSPSGVMIADPGATAASGIDGVNGGAIDGYSATSGRNIAVITFDAVVEASAYSTLATNGGLITNKALIEDYSNSENSGVNTFLPGVESISESASLSLRTGEVKKAIVSTSELSTTNNNVAIGEIIRYRLQVDIPEGVLNDFELIDALPAGLSFLNDGSAKLALAGANPNTFSWNLVDNPIGNFFIAGSGNNSSIVPIQAAPAPALSSNSKILTWALGDLVNLDRENNITESVILEFNALVDNLAATKKGTTLENSGQFNFNGIRSQSNKVAVTVVEPQFEFTKTVFPSSGSDAGDLLNYKVVLKNIGNSVAFNLQVVDSLGNLGANFDLQSVAIDSQPALANASISSSITNAASAAAGDQVKLLADQLQPNESLTFSYSGVLLAALQPGSKLTNEALIRYTSLPGERGSTANPTGSSTPGASGANNGERNGSGDSTAPNNYFKSTSISINSRGFAATKTARLTSEPSSSANNLAIGEIVRFRLQAQLPEGNIKALQFVDSLPAGFEFINDGSARLGFASASASNLTWNNGQLLANYYLAASGNNNSLIPTELFQPSLSNSNQILTWNLGDVVNLDRDNNSIESVIAEFNARVRNISSNKAKVDLTNTATINTDNVANNAKYSETFSAPKQSIVEPKLSITKLASEPPSGGFQAGDLVTYTITISNSGTATAFDLLIDDPLTDLGNSFNLQAVNTQGLTGAIDNSSTSASSAPADRVSIVIPSLNPGQSLSFSYSGQLTSALQINSSLDNTATVFSSSLPQNGTEIGSLNQTGSANSPNSSGTGSGERNGSQGATAGGLNNYAAPSTARISSRSIGFRKSLQSSSEANSSGSAIYIGEVLRYRLQADFPGGTSANLIITDLLPEGITYQPGSTRLALASQLSSELDVSSIPNEPDYFVVANSGNLSIKPVSVYLDPIISGLNATWNFGNIINSNSFDNQVESIILEFDLIVANQKPLNVNGRSFANSAKLEAGNLEAANAIQVTTEPLVIKEPSVDLIKTADKNTLNSLQNPLDNTIQYKLVVSNKGTATAYDLDLRDQLPIASNGAQLDLVVSSIKSVAVGGASDLLLAVDNGSRLLHGGIAKLPVGAAVTITYLAKLSDQISVAGSPDVPNSALRNRAFVSYSSLPGENSNERDGSDGIGTGLNNYAITKEWLVNVSSSANIISPLIVDEDNLIGAGDEGPNKSFLNISNSFVNLQAGSFGINNALLKLGTTNVPLDGAAVSVQGLKLIDGNGSSITIDPAGNPILWDYGIAAARVLRAKANNVDLIRIEFPSFQPVPAAGSSAISIKATLLSSFSTHSRQLADNAYSNFSAVGWQGAVELQGINLLFSDASATANSADNVAVSIPIVILDDMPGSPGISGPLSACYGGQSKSGGFVIKAGADNKSIGLVVDANGNGSYDAEVELVSVTGEIKNLLDRSFTIDGKGVLSITTDVKAGVGNWLFTPTAFGSEVLTQTFSIGTRDADGDIKLSSHSIVLNTKGFYGNGNDRELLLNEDGLIGAGGENAGAKSVGIIDKAKLVLQAGSLAATGIGFNSDVVALAGIRILRAGNDVTANLVDLNSNLLYSFLVSSENNVNDTLTILWANVAVARLNLAQTSLQIEAGKSGEVELQALLLRAMPSHLVKNQDGSYEALVFEGLPLLMQAAEGCSAQLSVSLSANDDRPALRVINSSGLTSSSVAANSKVSGTWGGANNGLGGYASSVGADSSIYSNADFSAAARWELIVNGATYNSSIAKGGILIAGFGRLSVDGDGNWNFESDANIVNQKQVSFSIAVVDADGDKRSFNHRITVQAANAPELVGPQLVVDENNLTLGDGKGPNLDVLVSDQKNVQLTAKTSAITSLKFTAGSQPDVLDANGQVITGLIWQRSADGVNLVASYGGIDVLRVQLPNLIQVPAGSTASIPLIASLLSALPHHGIADDNYSIVNSTVGYNGVIEISKILLEATAANGQISEASASVLILDDMPALLNLTGSTNTFYGATISLTGSFLVKAGADRSLSNPTELVELLTFGDRLTLSAASPTGFLALNNLGRFDVSVDFGSGIGSWFFTAAAQGAVPEQLPFTFTVQDADGDQRSASSQINIGVSAGIDLGATGGLLILNEDALSIPLVGPDSPFTPTFNNTPSTGAKINIKIESNSDQVNDVRFDVTKIALIQASAPGLSYKLSNQEKTLNVYQAADGAGAIPIEVANVSLGSLSDVSSSVGSTNYNLPITAYLLSNLVTHTASSADNKYLPLDFNLLPIVIGLADQSRFPIRENLKLRIFDDVPRVGVADSYADLSEAVSITALSGEQYVDLDTLTRTAAGGQIQGTWGVLGENNGGRAGLGSNGLDASSGADGVGGGPLLAGQKSWQLWVDIDKNATEDPNEIFDSASSSLLDGNGPSSGLVVSGLGRFKFWDNQQSKAAGWAFKADPTASAGAFDFRITVRDGDGDSDSQSHRIEVASNPLDVGQNPAVNLYLLLDNSTSMKGADPASATANNQSRLETQNRSAFIALQQAAALAGYGYYTDSNSPFYNFDDTSINNVLQTGSETIAKVLNNYQLADDPADGVLAGKINIHVIKFGYIVEYQKTVITPISVDEGIAIAQQVLLTNTPDITYGNSIDSNPLWKARGLPPPGEFDYYQGPNTLASNLYSGTEILGAFTGFKNLLQSQVAATAPGSLETTFIAMSTDGRPERRYWWDNRPERGSSGVGVALPTELGGDLILSSGLLYDQAGNARPTPTSAGVDQWSLTQQGMNSSLDALAARLSQPASQLQVSALGTGDGSSARFPSIYQDLLGNRTFDNTKSNWSYNWSGSGALPAFTG